MDIPQRSRTPVRLVVCVDGTWFGPDGIYAGWAGNISNIFRIWCCVKEGEVLDDAGNKWTQQRVYVKGVDNPSNWGSRLLSGAFGMGIAEQIKDVYKLCCEKAGHPYDQIFFFGFSRGAFVVRAVANLLAHMRIAGSTPSNQSFDDLYAHMLDLYKDVRAETQNRKGSIHEYMSHCRPHPKLQYIGVIDTVKGFDDDGLYDIAAHPSLQHCRHALALNEVKTSFVPELWLIPETDGTQSSPDVQEAWFLGSHGDLGGGNSQDGTALWSCQWLLSQAKEAGLVLEFTPADYVPLSDKKELAIEDPLELCFLRSQTGEEVSGSHQIRCSNGLLLPMWDITSIHKQHGYDLKLGQRQNHWMFSTAPRKVFDGDRPIGYHERSPSGVVIHPSVYLLHDTDSRVSISAQAWPFAEQLMKHREKSLPDSQDVFWTDTTGMIAEIDDAKIRILVCGDAGVGKSTLINAILGTPNLTAESETEHGVHHIEAGFSPEGARYIIHDSCGFQTGQQNEIERVKSFLRSRSTSGEFAERLHVILYCIASTRLRTSESADKEFFETLATCDASVPVVIVATRIDELEALYSDRAETEIMDRLGYKSRRHMQPADWDEVESETNASLDARKRLLGNDFAKLQFPFSGPVFTSKRDRETIDEVVSTITESLNDETVRLIFIASQVSSVQPKIDYALAHSLSIYTNAVRTAALPIAWSGLAAASTATVLIVTNVLRAFGYTGYSRDMASQIISTSLISNYQSNGIYVAGTVVNAAAAAAVTTGVGAAVGAAGWYAWKMVVIPQFGRLLLMCTVDTILIMEMAFWQCKDRAPGTNDIKTACSLYQSKVDQIHEEVKGVLPIWDTYNAFQFEKLRIALNKIINEHRLKKNVQAPSKPP